MSMETSRSASQHGGGGSPWKTGLRVPRKLLPGHWQEQGALRNLPPNSKQQKMKKKEERAEAGFSTVVERLDKWQGGEVIL